MAPEPLPEVTIDKSTLSDDGNDDDVIIIGVFPNNEAVEGEQHFGYNLLPQDADDAEIDAALIDDIDNNIIIIDSSSSSGAEDDIEEDSESTSEEGNDSFTPVGNALHREHSTCSPLQHLNDDSSSEETGSHRSNHVSTSSRVLNDIDMGESRVEQIRAAMANIVLPQSAVPLWARDVPEEQWHKILLEKIGVRKSK